MSVRLFKFIDGYDSNGYKRIVKCIFDKNTSIEEINFILDEYINIHKILGYKETFKNMVYEENEFTLIITYTNEIISKFILNYIKRNIDKKYIIRKALNLKKYIWNEEIIEWLLNNEIPFIEISKDILQIGYGKKSIKIDREILKNQFQSNILKLFTYIKDNNIGYIPLISITGTNGKTTTTRIIHNILLQLGDVSGMSSTGGIYIKNKKILSGDTTGYLSAREILKNPEVEIGVLETARGGIIKRGLGYLQSDVAIITSISEDHIGMNGIKNLDELAKVKATILKAINENGKAIVPYNKHIIKFIDETKYRVCYFSIKPIINTKEKIKNLENELIFLRDNHLIYVIKGQEHDLGNIKNINFCHNGISKSNIKNIMCSIAALKEFYDLNDIMRIIGKLECDLTINSGRQNILDINNFKIILDYGHNGEAFKEVFSIAKEIKHNRIISIIAAPGDRKDKYIKELGRIAAENSDEIIIREQKDLRERKKGETANLLRQGVLMNSFKEENIEIIYKEEDALDKAMRKAKNNDIIILFTQCLDVIIPVINDYLKEKKLSILEVSEDVLLH